jgi:GTP-binding protein
LIVLAAEFVKSAVGRRDLPADGLPEIAFVGRSNVGKSSLINALVRARVARTGAAPGKTRLVNLYRVRIEPGSRQAPRSGGRVLYLVDLPGYGYTRGGTTSIADFAALTSEFFGDSVKARPAARPSIAGVVLAMDARHPGLTADRTAYDWLTHLARPVVVVATKIDRLNRRERQASLRALANLVGEVLPVSAVSGEGLDELWTHIIRLCSNHPTPRRKSSTSPP